ncbi:MAG TPA: RsmE family RNA methyltransferase [Phycisphaerales bacterium]|nr:RsmE family RNA methyltransferase [Phycisphaerales bacterium]
MHLFYQPQLDGPVPVVTIGGDEAHHAARVKRMEAGDAVRVLNGRGLVVEGVVATVRKERGEWVVDVRAGASRLEARRVPAVRVLAGVPKGDRLEQMIDGLSQVGAASWAALVSTRSVVDPREGKIDRLRRVCEESLKQCGRAWLLDVGEKVDFAEALRGARGEVVLADASGGRYAASGAGEVTLVVGPEGGLTPEEVALARDVGAKVCSFGVHTMRVEVAAVVATGMIVDAGGSRMLPPR